MAIRSSGNIFADLGFDTDYCATLVAKSDLSNEILKIAQLRLKNYRPKNLAKILNISTRQANHLMNGRISSFSENDLREYRKKLLDNTSNCRIVGV